jgi:integrase
VLRIIGKGNKERLVPLPQPILDELGQLWRSHHNPRWLFPNRRGDAPLNTSLLADTFTAAAVAAGYPARRDAARPAPFLRNAIDRERRRHPRRADPAQNNDILPANTWLKGGFTIRSTPGAAKPF